VDIDVQPALRAIPWLDGRLVEERNEALRRWKDKPDDVVWKQEAWDKNEMPKIPMVDLPEKLEDIVGDLVKKEKELDDNAQDTTSNAATADIPAGWDVADGPISNWSAKGASGNDKPNANEMAGRAGSGAASPAPGAISRRTPAVVWSARRSPALSVGAAVGTDGRDARTAAAGAVATAGGAAGRTVARGAGRAPSRFTGQSASAPMRASPRPVVMSRCLWWAVMGVLLGWVLTEAWDRFD
jgi:hypothetical protein